MSGQDGAYVRRAGRVAIKVIAVTGGVVFILLFLISLTLKERFRQDDALRVPPGPAQSPFDGARAFTDVQALVELGPRPAGSESAAAARVHITREIENRGLRVKRQGFAAETPAGQVALMNLITVVEGDRPGVILLSTHYDTRPVAPAGTVGANDGASASACLLEFARAMGPRREGMTIWLAWLDGKYASGSDTAAGWFGAQALLDSLRKSRELPEVRAVIDLDMIGDCFLGIHRDQGAPDWLTDLVWEGATGLGYGAHFQQRRMRTPGNHTAFRAAGVPALGLRDAWYGAGPGGAPARAGADRDTLDRVCSGSLQAVGDVIYHSLPDVEAYLHAAGNTGAREHRDAGSTRNGALADGSGAG